MSAEAVASAVRLGDDSSIKAQASRSTHNCGPAIRNRPPSVTRLSHCAYERNQNNFDRWINDMNKLYTCEQIICVVITFLTLLRE